MKIDIRDIGNIESFYGSMTPPEGYGAFSGNQNEIEFPRKLQLYKISNMEFEDIDWDDYPDFCDAFCSSADMNGIEMTEEELDDLNENHPEFVYEKLFDKLF